MQVPEEATSAAKEHELKRLRDAWWWLLLLGVLLVVGGIIALAYPFVSSVGFILVLGAILIFVGAAIIIASFWAGKWSALLVQLLVGILYVIAGIAIRDTPVESTAVLTLLIAAFFIVVGLFRIVAALVERFPQWGWALLNGVITLIAGIVIYDTFPVSALWVIGLLVGLELLFNGWTWIMLALEIRGLPPDVLGHSSSSSKSSGGHGGHSSSSGAAWQLARMLSSSSSSSSSS
jgi:uncharacterized membrane protein HdeD (DUF308 family)